MINQELLRGQSVQVNMYNLNRTINSKAVFNQQDVKTAVIVCQLVMDNYLDLTDCAIRAEILKPDGTTVIQKAQILDAQSGLVAVGLTEQCLSAVGNVIMELVIQNESQILYSPKIAYIVVDNLFDVEGVESTDELPILNVLIAEVLNVQKELGVLETTINSNELIRNTQEEQRQVKDVERTSTMDKFKSDFKTIQENADAKIIEVDEEIKRSLASTDKQVQRVDDKIVEINDKIEVINSTFATKLEEIDTTMEEVSQDVINKIAEINSKLIEVDTTMRNIVAEFNEKLNYVDNELSTKLKKADDTLVSMKSDFDTKLKSVDKSLSDKLSSVDSSLSSKLTEITQQVNNRLSGYDAKVVEINNKIQEMNTTKQSLTDTVTSKVSEVNAKISGYDAKITEVNNLVSTVTSGESSRVQAEQDRTNTFNSIVSELEVTQSDIDDILGMVGGL